MADLTHTEIDQADDPALAITYVGRDDSDVTFTFTLSVEGDARQAFPEDVVKGFTDRETLHNFAGSVFQEILALLGK